MLSGIQDGARSLDGDSLMRDFFRSLPNLVTLSTRVRSTAYSMKKKAQDA
jgi:hypothetical protein